MKKLQKLYKTTENHQRLTATQGLFIQKNGRIPGRRQRAVWRSPPQSLPSLLSGGLVGNAHDPNIGASRKGHLHMKRHYFFCPLWWPSGRPDHRISLTGNCPHAKAAPQGCLSKRVQANALFSLPGVMCHTLGKQDANQKAWNRSLGGETL